MVQQQATASDRLQRIAAVVRQAEIDNAQNIRRAAHEQKYKLERRIARMRNNLGLGLQGGKGRPPWMAHPGREARELIDLKSAEATLTTLLTNELNERQ